MRVDPKVARTGNSGMPVNSLHILTRFMLILAFSSGAVCAPFAYAVEAPAPVTCESWLKKKTREAAASWRSFRHELRTEGARRLILAPRTGGTKFNKMNAFLDPVVDLPLETASYLKWRVFKRGPLKKRLSLFVSLPVGIVAWGVALGALDMKANQWAYDGLSSSVKADSYGAAYATEWVLSGSMGAASGLSYLRHEQSDFAVNLKPLRERVQQFQSENLWTAEQAQAVNGALDRLRAGHAAQELFKESLLAGALAADPAYAQMNAKLPAQLQFTTRLLTEPTMQVRGQADSYWLARFFLPTSRQGLSADQLKGLASIERIYKFHAQDLSIATLTKLVAETLDDKDALAAKAARARELGIAETNDFIYRADIPLFSEDETFQDLQDDLDLPSEIDRWALIMKDIRFADLRSSWQAGEISDLSVLMRAEVQLRALGDLNRIYRNSGLTLQPEVAWQLIYGAADIPANPLFASLRDLAAKINLTPQLSAVIPSVQYDLAALYFSTFVASEAQTSEAARHALFSAGLEKEKQILAKVTAGTYQPHAGLKAHAE